MSFDRVAPYYRSLETLVFGQQLQEARVAFVGKIDAPRRVLVVGEGNGRFLAEFVRAHPAATIDCLDASARMIELARSRVQDASVRLIQGDIREVDLHPGDYDLLVTHFVLDCFVGDGLREVVQKLAAAAKPEAVWLLADFCLPSSGWQRWHAELWVRAMYLFFRLTSGLEASRLEDPAPFLRATGFERDRERRFRSGMIQSAIWRRLAVTGA